MVPMKTNQQTVENNPNSEGSDSSEKAQEVINMLRTGLQDYGQNASKKPGIKQLLDDGYNAARNYFAVNINRQIDGSANRMSIIDKMKKDGFNDFEIKVYTAGYNIAYTQYLTLQQKPFDKESLKTIKIYINNYMLIKAALGHNAPPSKKEFISHYPIRTDQIYPTNDDWFQFTHRFKSARTMVGQANALQSDAVANPTPNLSNNNNNNPPILDLLNVQSKKGATTTESKAAPTQAQGISAVSESDKNGDATQANAKKIRICIGGSK